MGRRKSRQSKDRVVVSVAEADLPPCLKAPVKNAFLRELAEYEYFERVGGFRPQGKRRSKEFRVNRRRNRWQFVKQVIRMGNAPQSRHEPPAEVREAVLGYDCSADKIIESIKEGKYKNIVVMAGAGISVSCGIPDFRSPGTGLYDNLQRFNLPTPESVFELKYFKETKGMAFYKLAKEMWPDHFEPSPTHLFVRMLHDKGLLLRCFTQNIDTLERAAGVPDEKLVEAHGSFASSSCTKCSKPFDQAQCKAQILEGNIPVRCAQAGCGGLVKPDIVFFGEGLPAKFQLCTQMDMPKADLLIVMGTSLTVQPFANLVELVEADCPRLLLNMKPVGLRIPDPESNGLRLRQAENYRDAMIEGPCDDAVRAICDQLGWRAELEELVEQFKCRVGASAEPIDISAAFPTMAPNGLKYNWRPVREAAVALPGPKTAAFRPEAVEVSEIEQLARADADGLALVALNEYTKLKRGGTLAALLCLTDAAHENWETTHSLALVASSAEDLDFATISNSEVLMEPMNKEGAADEPVSFHQVAFQIPDDDDLEAVYIWYVDSTKGSVAHRWGPFALREPIPGEDDDSEDEAEKEATEDLMDEIIRSMGDLPAHLQSSPGLG